MTTKQELEQALIEALKYQAELEEAIARVAAKRNLDRQNETVLFFVELPDGSLKHETESFERALEASRFYDGAHVVSQVRQPYKRVTASEPEEIEGN